jgi:hypothetical protein
MAPSRDAVMIHPAIGGVNDASTSHASASSMYDV